MTGKEQILTDLAELLQRDIIRSLEQQGHVASGKLKESLKVNVEKVTGGFAIVGSYLYYGRFVDTGRRARVKRVPIDALIQWIRDKRLPLNGQKERDVAFKIQHAIYKKGIPTDGDTSKLRFLRSVLESNEKRVQTTIRAYFQSVIVLSIRNSITEATRIAA